MAKGKLILILGPMFSGKTTTLISKLKEKENIRVFKPTIDNRYSEKNIVTHTGETLEATPINTVDEILPLISKEELIGFDEVQFFDSQLIQLTHNLLENGRHLIMAGLDRDFNNNSFGIMPNLIALADEVISLKAKCFICEKDAEYTYRKPNLNTSTFIGGVESYEARCYNCYIKT